MWTPIKTFTDIKLEKTSDGIAKITINRPEVRNAFRPLTVRELLEAFDIVHEDRDVGVIILCGEGPLAFCSGGDQKVRGEVEALKSSTSELISNDAINLSVFIIDNLGMDTIETPMQMFAQAELLMYQNRDEEARGTLDTITYLFPGHALFDDIEYAKAQMYVKKKEFEKAVPLLEDIIKTYKEDLKGDDATFLLAKIYEDHLNNKEKAMDLYKAVITDYNSSLLVIEAKEIQIIEGR